MPLLYSYVNWMDLKKTQTFDFYFISIAAILDATDSYLQDI